MKADTKGQNLFFQDEVNVITYIKCFFFYHNSRSGVL